VDVTVSGRHTTVSEKLRNYAVDKIGKCDRYLGGMDRAEVHFWEEKNPRIDNKEFCEVTIEGHGHHIRCKVSAPDGFTAVDLAEDKLERQLRKLKTKVQNRKQGRDKPEIEDELVPDSLLGAGQDDPEPVYKIVKSKRFEVAAMESGNAALEMDLLNHDFYVFINAETSKPAVVYRRDDGDIGLIDIEG
jgi:putative sigma-54 modulation protein